MKYIITLIVILLFNIGLYSQNKLTVFDTKKNPIEGVEVLISDLNLVGTTNQNGEFILNENIPTYTTIRFFKEGYKSKIVEYEDDLKIYLSDLHVNVDEIEISSINSRLSNSKAHNINFSSIINTKSEFNSLGDKLASINGVSSMSSGYGIQKIVIRGLSGMRVVTYLNGIRVENQQWANDHGIPFTELGIHKVELVKGPSSILFGNDALGGVLYFTDEPFSQEEKTSGYFSSQFESSHYLFSNDFGLKFSKNNFYLNVFGKYALASDYKIPDGRYVFNSRFKKSGFKLSSAYNSSKWIAKLFYQFDWQRLGIPAHSHDINPNLDKLLGSSRYFYLSRPNQFADNHLLNFQNTFFINELKIKIDVGHFINRLQEYEAWTISEFDLLLSSTQFNFNLNKPINEYLKINFGGQSILQKNKNLPSRSILLPDFTSNDYGIFSILEYEKNNWGAALGLRGDIRKIKAENISPSFEVMSTSLGVYKSINNHNLKISYSNGFRSPHTSELLTDGVHHGTNRYEVGNQSLTEEKAYQFDLKYDFSNNHFGIVVNPFFNIINDYISINPTDSFVENYKVYFYDQFNKVYIKGIESNIHYHPHFLHNIHIEHNFSIIKANRENNENLALIPANKFSSKIKYHFNRSILKHIGFEHHFFAKKTDISFNEITTDSYHIINLKIDFKVNKKFSTHVGINNLLNKTYTPHISRLKQYEIPNPGRSVSINLNYKF